MMRRIGFSLLAILAVAVGLVIGTFNSESVSLDLLWFQLEWPLGLILLCAFAIGLIIGLLLVNILQVLPLRLRIRKLQAAGDVTIPKGSPGDDA